MRGKLAIGAFPPNCQRISGAFKPRARRQNAVARPAGHAPTAPAVYHLNTVLATRCIRCVDPVVNTRLMFPSWPATPLEPSSHYHHQQDRTQQRDIDLGVKAVRHLANPARGELNALPRARLQHKAGAQIDIADMQSPRAQCAKPVRRRPQHRPGQRTWIGRPWP